MKKNLLQRSTLQLDTATIFEIVCRPAGSCSAYIGLAGCADIVTFTFLTQGRIATTSFAFCSNCHAHIFIYSLNNTADLWMEKIKYKTFFFLWNERWMKYFSYYPCKVMSLQKERSTTLTYIRYSSNNGNCVIYHVLDRTCWCSEL